MTNSHTGFFGTIWHTIRTWRQPQPIPEEWIPCRYVEIEWMFLSNDPETVIQGHEIRARLVELWTDYYGNDMETLRELAADWRPDDNPWGTDE